MNTVGTIFAYVIIGIVSILCVLLGVLCIVELWSIIGRI